MIKKIKLILHYGSLETAYWDNGLIKYAFICENPTVSMDEGSTFINKSLEDLVKEVITHIPNIDKL